MVKAVTDKESLLSKGEKNAVTKLQPAVNAALAKGNKKEAVRLIDEYHRQYSLGRRYPEF
jgi:hypothetical protein